jgi:P4 family phage/plasmid primase-like protien
MDKVRIMYHSQFRKESTIIDAPQDFVAFKPCNNTLLTRLHKTPGPDGVKKEYRYPSWKFPGKILELNPETQQIEKRKQYTPNYFVGMLKQVQPKDASLATLAAQLTHYEQQDVVILRGSLHENLATTAPFFPEYSDINRRIKNEHTNPDGSFHKPTLKETSKTWAMFDLDGCACDASIEEMLTNPEKVIDAHIQKYLPEPFRGVSYYYQLSASWGLTSKPPFNCHLWFILNRPMTNEELRTYVKQLPKTDHCKLDHAVFNCVQPYFICPPKFDDSIDANHPIRLVKRSGLITNAKEVLELPTIALTPELNSTPEKKKNTITEKKKNTISSLFTALEKLKFSSEGERHNAIVNAGYTLSFFVNADIVTQESALAYADAMIDANKEIKPNEKSQFKRDMYNSLRSALLVNKQAADVVFNLTGYRFNYLSLLDAIPNDLAECSRIIKEFINGELLYINEYNTLYTYDKTRGCYVPDSNPTPMQLLQDILSFSYRVFNDNLYELIKSTEEYIEELKSDKHSDNKEVLAQELILLKNYTNTQRMLSRALVNEGFMAYIKRLYTIDLTVSINIFDSDPQLINFTNGYLDLRDTKFTPHDTNPKRELFLKSTGYSYDPKQTSPFWDRAVDIWAGEGNAENAFFIKKALGYTLNGVKENKVFFFIHAPKDSGKTTFMRAVSAALGTYTAELNPSAWIQDARANRDERRNLIGARFAWSDEVYHEFGNSLDTAFLKTLTGGASIEVACKYEKPITFKPQATPYILSNDALKIPPGDAAFWNRARCIRLETVPYGKRMRFEFTDQLKQAIFNWLLEGYHECLRSNDLFEPPTGYKEALLNYRQEGNHVDEFINDNCVVDPNAKMLLDSLYDVYADFVKTNNYRRYAKKRFVSIIQSLHPSIILKRPRSSGGAPRPFYIEGIATIEWYHSSTEYSKHLSKRN